MRTPLEFAIDHIPGATNAPVLSNEERIVIGTMYCQESPFQATRLGAALVAKNIGRHLETVFADRPRNWRPLVYCWRGGKRSEAMTSWLNMVGWQARQLDGGYKAYRRWVVRALDDAPTRFSYYVLLGHTGTGKTRLLQALGAVGAQILDLEQLACHRGSLLGAMPGQPQPGQKKFESGLMAAFRRFDPDQPIFIEAESARIGRLTLPKSLLDAFHQGVCIELSATFDERIAFLLEDYSTLFSDTDAFKRQLERLTGLHSKDTIARWYALIDAGQRASLFRELIGQHYDPAYTRSQDRHFLRRDVLERFAFHPNSDDIQGQARQLLQRLAAHSI